MRALLFSDLHQSFKQLDNLYRLIEAEDLKTVIFAGDFLDMGETMGFARTFADVFLKTQSNLLWVPGNNDFGPGYYILKGKYKSLEGRVVEANKKKFCGVGGSPASWAGQYSGETMIDQASIGGSVFVSHVPPPGILNYQKNDHHSPSLRKFSDSPLVHICGHIHSQYGVAFLGQTKVIKLAPLLYGYYAIMDLENFAIDFRRFHEHSYLRKLSV